MKFKNGKEVDSLEMIIGMKKMPRVLRRNLWKKLKVSDGLSWAEYREIEGQHETA